MSPERHSDSVHPAAASAETNAPAQHVLPSDSAQDALAQTFAAILVQLRAAEELARTDPRAAATLRRQAERLAECGLVEARRSIEAEGGGSGLARALARLARWADRQRLCACSFVDAGAGRSPSPAVAAAAYHVARALIVDAVQCRALRRIDVVLESSDAGLVITLDGDLFADAPRGWIDAVRDRVDEQVRAAAGTLSAGEPRDPHHVRVVAAFRYD